MKSCNDNVFSAAKPQRFLKPLGFIVILIYIYYYKKNKDKITIILFYRDGCGFCEKIEPEWNKFKTMVGPNIEIKKIDSMENTDMASDFNVVGVPHIVRVQGTKRYVYSGDRSAEDLLRFANERN